jgi:predicted O-methyltransferase YrrM
MEPNTLSSLPAELDETLQLALNRAHSVPGFMVENELRFLATLAACSPAAGAIVEIGSFKGKSTVALATVAAKYQLGQVVAIDPHVGDLGVHAQKHADTFEEFRTSLKSAGVENQVEAHREFSRDAARGWNRPIRLLWIDGDHTYTGCKEDFDLFSTFVADGGVIAFHDTLNTFEGPIRVFVEDVLRSDRFGACGFVHSVSWAQFRPNDGSRYRRQRVQLAKCAEKLIPYVARGQEPTGLRKKLYKLQRSRVPRKPISAATFLQMIASPPQT